MAVPVALVLLMSGGFVPAARAASTRQTQDQGSPTSGSSTTTTQLPPSTSTTYVTMIVTSPATVTTTASFPFIAPAEDAFPPSTMPPEPEQIFDRDLGAEPQPVDRDPLPAGGADPAALSDTVANRTGPSTTLAARPMAGSSNPASPVVASEAAIDLSAANRSPSLFWPGVLVLGCLCLLGGPAANRRLRRRPEA